MISGLSSLPMAPADTAASAVETRLRERPIAREAFIAGPENALVRTLSAAVSQAELPFNPIVIYGHAGVGKSSLAHALAAQRREQLALSRMIATTGAELFHGLAHAIDTASTSEFRARHHHCELLLIDDLHRLTGKAPAQQFLVTAIDALIRRGVLVIATLRQAPQAADGLSPALVSRLSGGLVVELALPGALARRELVRQAAASAGVLLREDEVAALANGDKGAAHSMATPARLRHAVLELSGMKEFGGSRDEIAAQAAGQPSETKAICRQVAATVARQFELTLTDLKSQSRRQALVEARSLAMYIARQITGASYAEIGRYFGDRDHTTVLHACRKVTQAVADDKSTRRIADDLIAQIVSEGAS